MVPVGVVVTAFLCLLTIAAGFRLSSRHSVEGRSTNEVGSRLIGQMLGEFRLRRQIHQYRLPSGRGSALLQEGLIPEDKVRKRGLLVGLGLGRFLGKGSFEAVYEATRGGESFLVKFVYKKEKAGDTVLSFATGDDAQRDPVLLSFLTEMNDECAALQELQSRKEENPAGASRIIKCVLNCFPGDNLCPRAKGEPHFIVMENAGEDGSKWLRARQRDGDYASVERVLTQIAQGVSYLAETLSPPRIHHDMKWSNICVQNRSGQWEVKLIDLSSMVKVEEEYTSVTPDYSLKEADDNFCYTTPGYSPPEADDNLCYRSPASSWDVYSLGMMALKGLCNTRQAERLHFREWAVGAMRQNDTTDAELRYKLSQLSPLNETRAKDCAKSMSILVHPEATHRAAPGQVVFRNLQAFREAAPMKCSC